MDKTRWTVLALSSSAIISSLLLTKRLPHSLLIKLLVNVIFSIVVFLFTLKTIPKCVSSFVNAHLSGKDQGKMDRRVLPESLGIVSGAFYLVTICIYIPIKFFEIQLTHISIFGFHHLQITLPILRHVDFAQDDLISMLAAILAICCMLMLGFVDDVLNLKWRQKLIFPLVASLPLLIVYYVTYNQTHIMLPKPWHFAVNLSVFYYVFMCMVVIFCTNAINILAGVNGLEVGQSVIIGTSIVIFNLIEMGGEHSSAHEFSFIFIMPFLGVSLALLAFNWYPAEVFVGDTYCYFAGVTFAVVGILGHFSKTMLLFFIPQIFNFLFSIPQLFHLLPCPRHRLPTYNGKHDQMSCSYFKYVHDELKFPGRIFLYVYKKFGLVSEERVRLSSHSFNVTNCTIINLLLNWYGPMKESNITIVLLLVQCASSVLAFFIRYYISKFFY